MRDKESRRRTTPAAPRRPPTPSRAAIVPAARIALGLAVAPWLGPALGGEVPPPPVESRILSSEELGRDAHGNPRFDDLPFVGLPLEAPPEVQARLEALEKQVHAEESAEDGEVEEGVPSLPEVPELAADPLTLPRMDEGDPNPDGINASKLELLEQRYGR